MIHSRPICLLSTIPNEYEPSLSILGLKCAKQATCQICNLTARNDEELADHVRHAHGSETAK